MYNFAQICHDEKTLITALLLHAKGLESEKTALRDQMLALKKVVDILSCDKRAGDPTLFRHIDMNVRRYLESGRRGNMIQGSVSLTTRILQVAKRSSRDFIER